MQCTQSISQAPGHGRSPSTWNRIALAGRSGLLLGSYLLAVVSSQAATPLADQPLFTNTSVPGNLVLALSVEFPTAVSVAHQGKFVAGKRYLGYFDPGKCYRYYKGNATDDAAMTGDDVSHFYPVGAATSDYKCTATGLTDTWSGSFMNWMTMQAIDPFRWALTGGYRRVDNTTTTILERAWATSDTNNGSDTNFPLIPTADLDLLKERPSPSSTDIADHTPLSLSSLKVSVRTRGNQVWFTRSATLDSGTTGTPTHYTQALSIAASTIYSFYARVKVCDAGAGTEANCKQYGSNYKPEGLLQQYADKIRFSAFGYLNDPTDNNRAGGVLRARQKFVGPTVTNPGSAATANPAKEWDATTGVIALNPDAADATDTANLFGVPANKVANSGVINYLNKFGQQEKTYKRHDPVSELYYAALRYLKKQGNVDAWTSIIGESSASIKSRLIDGFPVIKTWDDPIQYSCQRNFILGIGDTNSAKDRKVEGDLAAAVAATNKVGSLQGMGGTPGTAEPFPGGYLIAGLAYDANTKDIRPDVVANANTIGKQTVQTYWLDVLEFGAYVNNNQYYLAAKYGGFKVPDGYVYGSALTESWWDTNTDTTPNGQPRPDNYYTVARPDQMVDGLTKAFANIASALKATTTSFSTTLPQVSVAGNASFAAKFDSEDWTGDVAASELSFNPTTGAPSQTEAWRFSDKLATQLAGAGWDTGRRVITWNPATGTGVPFRVGAGGISSTQQATLDTAYRTGDDSADYLKYLRGDRMHEQASTVSGSSRAYRTRFGLLGDVVGAKSRPIGPPSLPLSNASNPGYGTFKSTRAGRPTIVYVGANDGMLHAINGALTGTDAGKEMFAYVPSALFAGPTGAPGSTGLAALGNPTFEHHYYVNATPAAFDIDFGRTAGGSGTADWRSVLIGGLGKGGKSYYALDITDPAGMSTEATAAAKVLWEFTDADMGYTYGEPTVVKTQKYGWVVILPSGHNNANGQGYFYIVNPRTGALLEKIGTGEGSAANPAGLANINAFVIDRSDGLADAAYAGDLYGNVWRLDLRPATDPYAAPIKIASLTADGGAAQPVTSRPLIEVDPATGRRFVLLGTGIMLDNVHIASTVQQSFYALVDGKATRFGTAAELPAGVSYPITRAKLADNTNLLDAISYDAATQIGWYIELGTGGSGSIGWRVVNDPTSAFGIVAFASTLPSGDVCKPSGSTRIYAVNFGTGKSVLTDADLFINYSTAITGIVTDLRFFTVGGVPRLIGGSDTGELKSIPGVFSGTATIRRLNWREVPVAN